MYHYYENDDSWIFETDRSSELETIESNFNEAMGILEGSQPGDWDDFMACFMSIGQAIGIKVDMEKIKSFTER